MGICVKSVQNQHNKNLTKICMNGNIFLSIDHFAGGGKMVDIGSESKREICMVIQEYTGKRE